MSTSEDQEPLEGGVSPKERSSLMKVPSLKVKLSSEESRPQEARSPNEATFSLETSLTEATILGEGESRTEPTSPGNPKSPGEGMSSTEPTSPGNPKSPGERKSPTEPTSPGNPKSPGERKSPTEPTSPGESTLPRDKKSPTEPTSPGEPMLLREKKSLTELKSPGEETIPRDGTFPEKTKSPEINTSKEQLVKLDQQKELTLQQQPVQVSPPPLPLPTANVEAINFLASITSEELALILFTDSLVTISDTGKELGEFTVSVHPTIYKGEQCVRVTANSHGSIDNIPCGTSISAHISNKLETLQLHHHEYIKLKDHSLVKETLMKKEDVYVLTRDVTMAENVKSETLSFSQTDMEGFVSEASNLLLLRIMARRNNVPDNMVFLSFDTEMQLSTCTYLNLGPRTMMIGKSECEVLSIQRTIHSQANSPMSWQSSFLPDGHLTSRVQVGSPITMRLKQLPHIIETDVEDPKPVFEKKPLNWEEDMQLYFKFLDRTEALKADYSSYIRHHPELKSILADFLQFLLLRKPQDVITFAAEYFSSFSTFSTEQSPFLTSKKLSPFKEP
ncbi:ciliogenesis-associated TTC17-interacting protein [Hypanus sabinus]|uniref:ciliogenesis-associated TTC17-interacting protein n=1 Tax=Hypanus sabinus TaxID=79690 RepID=UPI0028C3A802|nr:ciliogenesis-associated TTC17-interacting protein [Hypanus sabinus]